MDTFDVRTREGVLASIRNTRTQLLKATDWVMTADSPITGSSRVIWLAYRQALRDVTNQPDLLNIIWPTPP